MHLLTLKDWSSKEIGELIDGSLDIKGNPGEYQSVLKDRSLAMIFQKPSNRTRLSFQVGMYQLGGRAVYLSPEDIQLGKRESVADVARVLTGYVEGIMGRVFGHDIIVQLAHYAKVPVINGLTDLLHPCQVLGDLLTILEHRGAVEGTRVGFLGDGNNVAHSWLNAATRIPLDLRKLIPAGSLKSRTILMQHSSSIPATISMFFRL